MSNKGDGTLYVGVTNELLRRVWEHKSGEGSHFTRRYQLTTLVYFEWHDRIESAIQRERNIKHWKRQWKIDLIRKQNPEWRDLSRFVHV